MRPEPPEAGAPLPAEDELEVARGQALIFTRDREWALAAASWRALAARSGGAFEAQYRLAEALFSLRRLPEAIEAAQLALAQRPQDHRPKLFIARAQTNLGQFAAAAQSWRELVALQPGDYEGWARLGQCATQLGRHDEAAAALGRAITLNPANPFALQLVGQLFARVPGGEQDACLDAALAVMPQEAALALLRAVLAGDPSLAAMRARLRDLLAAQLAALQAGADAASQMLVAGRELGRSASECAVWDLAETIWRALRDLAPDDEEAILQLVRTAGATGRHHDARLAVSALLQRPPRDHEAARAQISFLSEGGHLRAATQRAAALLAEDRSALLWLLARPEPWAMKVAADAVAGAGNDHNMAQLRRVSASRALVEAIEQEIAGRMLPALLAWCAAARGTDLPDAAAGVARVERLLRAGADALAEADAATLGVLANADPRHLNLAGALARAWLAAGRALHVVAMLDRLAEPSRIDATLAALQGPAYARAGRLPELLERWQRWCEDAPGGLDEAAREALAMLVADAEAALAVTAPDQAASLRGALDRLATASRATPH